jgi:hypothetical protein
MSDKKIKRIAIEFRKGILGDRQSKSWCFAVSAPLCSYLSVCGIRGNVVEGKVGRHHHCWIELKDGRIVDATADQFKNPDGEPMPSVFVGLKPEWYKV